MAPEILLKVVPPSLLICHCTAGPGCPLAAAVNVAVAPAFDGLIARVAGHHRRRVHRQRGRSTGRIHNYW